MSSKIFKKKLRKRRFFIVLTFVTLIFLVLFLIFCINSNRKNSDKKLTESLGERNMSTDDVKAANTSEMPSDDVLSKKEIETSAGNSLGKDVSGKNTKRLDDYRKEEKKISPKNKDFSEWNKTCDWNLILLNDENRIPSGMLPELKDYMGAKVNAGILSCLDEMIRAAKKDGINLWISSCYRSIDYQTFLHNRKIKFYLDKGNNKVDAERLARKVVAAPGTSEHNLGLAIDFNGVRDDFYLTDAYKWLIKNSAEYGFILRYEENKKEITNKIYEPWHFRYVSKEHAKKMQALSLCLEEYIDFLFRSHK